MKMRGDKEIEHAIKERRAEGEVKPGIYGHYKKRGEYEVYGVFVRRDTGEKIVGYRACYGERLQEWKPLAEFTENIEHEGGYFEPRFFFIRDFDREVKDVCK